MGHVCVECGQGRGCVCREERLRARDHDDLIRRRPRTLRFRAVRGARGKMVAVNPIHFVMAHGDVRAGWWQAAGGWREGAKGLIMPDEASMSPLGTWP